MKITTQRILHSFEVKEKCAEYNYYTGGNCKDYENLGNRIDKLKNVSNEDIYNIAVDIIEHTPEFDIERDIAPIMFWVSELTHTFYTITD